MSTIDKTIADKCRAWPFEEAKNVVKRLRALNRGEIKPSDKGYVLFQTGYGPSGLPHIGTFQEVARTSMVMQAFNTLHPEIPTKLICFSDDMDGLRKVPGNVPNKALLNDALGMPLSSVPNPFDSDFANFAAHNNACLRDFLDQFGFDYEFISSSDSYCGGRFDDALRAMLDKYEQVREAVLPILGKERAATYSPLFPIVQKKGADEPHPIILHNAKLVEVVDLEAGMATFELTDDSELERSGYGAGDQITQTILQGQCKAQWRADWALRWFALDVDYEMAGEDLQSSADIAGDIVKILGGRKPAGFHYKLFLDEHNQKISKSKGNGISIDDWLTYAPQESLQYYVWQRPSSGKKLYFDVIPKAVDEYIQFIDKMNEQEDAKKLENPAWYIHNGSIPNSAYTPISFALLLNLVNAANTDDASVLWGFINQYAPDATPDSAPFLDRLVGFAIRYYQDFILPEKTYRAPDERESKALNDLAIRLEAMASKPAQGLEAEDYMTEVFSAGKENGYDKSELREWFQAIYEICLGQSQGPRFGSFIQLYGVKDTAALIRQALSGAFIKAA